MTDDWGLQHPPCRRPISCNRASGRPARLQLIQQNKSSIGKLNKICKIKPSNVHNAEAMQETNKLNSKFTIICCYYYYFFINITEFHRFHKTVMVSVGSGFRHIGLLPILLIVHNILYSFRFH